MLRVALFCEESAGAQMLRMLATGPYALVALLTSPPADATGGRVWRLAEQLGCTPTPAEAIHGADFPQRLAALRTDVILNIHSLHIVPEAVLRVPRFGAFNLHPGPLPAFAGLNAPSWSIYLGHDWHAVTLHAMEAGIDTGAIVYAERFAIGEEDTGLSVALKCVQKGLPLVQRLLNTIDTENRLPPLFAQNLRARRYYGRQPPHSGPLPWNQPARRIHDFVRACDYHPFSSPWGVPQALLEHQRVQILKTSLTGQPCRVTPGSVRVAENQTLVATADEWLALRRFRPHLQPVEPSPQMQRDVTTQAG